MRRIRHAAAPGRRHRSSPSEPGVRSAAGVAQGAPVPEVLHPGAHEQLQAGIATHSPRRLSPYPVDRRSSGNLDQSGSQQIQVASIQTCPHTPAGQHHAGGEALGRHLQLAGEKVPWEPQSPVLSLQSVATEPSCGAGNSRIRVPAQLKMWRLSKAMTKHTRMSLPERVEATVLPSHGTSSYPARD